MKKIKLFLLLSIWLWLPIVAAAQTMQEVELNQIAQVSPNAASLGKYGEHPVGLFTGIPNINIPFYNISSGRIKFPIGISYSMGGIKVEEIASNVGLGWSLNAGGVITRSIKGAPDEIDPPGFQSFLTTTVKVDSIMTLINNATLGIAKKVVGGKMDAEPDVFYFNFAGHSGKFMYHQDDQKFYSIPYNKMQIDIINSFGGVTAFRITDEDGLVYEFNEMEVSTRGITATTTTTTAWYLSSIFDPLTNNTVTFTYSHKNLYYETFSTETYYYNTQLPLYQRESSHKQDIAHATTSLKEITFNAGKVKFLRGLPRIDLPGDSALTEIKIFDHANNLVKDFDFTYSYFVATDFTGPVAGINERLKLTTVSEYSTDGSHNNPQTHTFDYNDGLPSRLSRGQDHWGYYNGWDGNVRLYPPMTVNPQPGVYVDLVGGRREVVENAALAGMLTQITYPTKGYTIFETENNRAYLPNAPIIETEQVVYAGSGDTPFVVSNSCDGLAYIEILGYDVSQILPGYPGDQMEINIIDSATNTVRGIWYIKNGKNDGINPVRFALPNGGHRITVDWSGNMFPESYAGATIRLTWKSCRTPTELEKHNQLVGGLRIKKIKNYDADHSLVNMKYYKYVDEANPSYSSGQTQFNPRYEYNGNYMPANADPFNGTFSVIKRYSQSNYPLVDEGGKSVGYSNVIELNGEDFTNGYTQHKFTNQSEYPDLVNDMYRVSRPTSFQWLRGLETEKKIFKYNGSSNELISKTVNEYDTTLLASGRKTFQGIRGVFRYLWDNDGVELDWPTEDLYFLGAVVASYEKYDTYADFVYLKKTVDSTFVGTNAVEQITNYTYNNRNLKASRIESRGSDGLAVGVVNKYPLDFSVTNATHPKSAGIYKLQLLNNINAPIEQYSYRVMPSTDKLLTGANYYSYRALEGLVDTVFSYRMPTMPVLNYTGITATPSTFVVCNNYQPEVIFEEYDLYNNEMNLLQQRKAGGAPISYLYDYGKVYPVAEVVGAGQSDIAYTSFEAQDHGNWSYSGTAVADATSPTGKKCYNLTTSNTLVKTGLNAAVTYLLSYWAKNGSSGGISGTVAQIIGSKNGWTRYQCRLSGITSVTLSGTVALDEVRLHPITSLMTTSTYDPLVGITSKTDAKGLTAYFEYDGHKRLKYVRDHNGNIVKSYCYNYAGQLSDCNGYLGGPILLPGLVETGAGYSQLSDDLCQMGQPGVPPHEFKPIYGSVQLGGPTMVGQPVPVYYTDAAGTILAPNGYYTSYEYNTSNGYRIYKLQNGIVIQTFWCYEF